MTTAFDIMNRFSNIRPMLDKKITNSEWVIGTYIMTICLLMGEGRTDEEIVTEMAKHGVDVRPNYR